MTTELATQEDIAGMTEQELMALTGQTEITGALPRLAVNYAADDDDGNTLPRGTYRIDDPEQGGMTIFGNEAHFRPLLRVYSYSIWDQEEKKFTVQTVQDKTLGGPFPDNKGGKKCGKLPKDEFNKLDEKSGEYAFQKTIKCNQIFYGVVSIPNGKTIKGKKAACKDVPCVWYVKGASFVPIGDFIKRLGKENKPMFKVIAKLTTTRQKAGTGPTANTYFVAGASPLKEVDFTPEDMSLLSKFGETVKGYNDYIMGQHNKAVASTASPEELDMAADLEDDLSDDVPF